MNILSCLLDEYAPLHHEAEFLLLEELRDLANYHAILLALAERPMSLTEVGTTVGSGTTSSTPPAPHPARLRRAPLPLTGQRPSKRSVRYVLDDPLLRFWFRFIGPNQSGIRVPGPRRRSRSAFAPARRLFRHLFRATLPRGVAPPLRARGRHGRVRDRGILGSGRADRRRRHAQRRSHRSRRVQMGSRQVGQVHHAELEDRVAHYPNPQTRRSRAASFSARRSSLPRRAPGCGGTPSPSFTESDEARRTPRHSSTKSTVIPSRSASGARPGSAGSRTSA